MPAIVATSRAKGSPRAATRTTLGVSGNPFTYVQGSGQLLILHNPTAGPLTPTITSTGGGPIDVEGLGSVNTGSGLSLGAIAASGQILVDLDFIAQYLKGTLDISGGSGLVATLLQ